MTNSYGAGTTHTIDVRTVDSVGQYSAVNSASATTAPPVQPQVIVSVGAHSGPYPNCNVSACAYVHLRLQNFAPNTNYSCQTYSSHGGGFATVTKKTAADGSWEGDISNYFGYPNETVWVICGGVESNHYVWPAG